MIFYYDIREASGSGLALMSIHWKRPHSTLKKQFSELNSTKIVLQPEQIAQMLSVLARPMCSQYLVLRLDFQGAPMLNLSLQLIGSS